MNALDYIRGLIRPVGTYTLILAQVGFLAAGMVTGDYEAAKAVGTLTGVAMTYYFVDRTNSKRDNSTP